MDGVAVVWEQIADFTDENRVELHRRIRPGVRIIRYPAVTTRGLFPFDDPEPHAPCRACYLNHGDRLAPAIRSAIGDADVPDRLVFELYEKLEREKMPNVERLLELDMLAAETRDRRADVAISDFIRDNFHDVPLFSNNGRPKPILFMELFHRLLEQTFQDDAAFAARVRDEVGRLSSSYCGLDDEEVPVSPLVAERLDLKWFNPGTRYRWRQHLWTRDQFIVNFIRLRSYVV